MKRFLPTDWRERNRLRTMAGKYRYAQAGLWYVVANVIGNGVVMLSAAVFTRLMSKSDYGMVSTYSAWVLVLNTFIGLNLFITVRNAYFDHRSDYTNYCSSILMLALLSNLLLTGIAVLGSALLPIAISPIEALLSCIQASSLHVINYRSAILSMENRYQRRSLLILLPNITHTLLSILLILLCQKQMYLAKITGNSIGLLLYAVLCVILTFAAAKPRVEPHYWKYSLAIALPSIVHTLSDLVLIQSDRLMLTAMVNAEETAEYSLIYNVGAVIVILYQAINGAWAPWFYEQVSKRAYRKSRRCQEVYLYVFAVITAGIATIAPELIRLLSPPSYWEGSKYIGWIIIASYLMYLGAYFSTFLMAKKKTGVIARNTAITALLNLLLNYLLIPRLHATGAVIATVVGYGVLFLLHGISAGKEGHSYFDLRKTVIFLVINAGYALAVTAARDLWLVRYIMFVVAFLCSTWSYGIPMVRNYIKSSE